MVAGYDAFAKEVKLRGDALKDQRRKKKAEGGTSVAVVQDTPKQPKNAKQANAFTKKGGRVKRKDINPVEAAKADRTKVVQFSSTAIARMTRHFVGLGDTQGTIVSTTQVVHPTKVQSGSTHNEKTKRKP